MLKVLHFINVGSEFSSTKHGVSQKLIKNENVYLCMILKTLLHFLGLPVKTIFDVKCFEKFFVIKCVCSDVVVFFFFPSNVNH